MGLTHQDRLIDMLDRATAMRPNRPEALRICRDVLAASEPALPHITARAWRVIGHTHLLDDDLEQAAEAYKESLRRAGVLGDATLTVHGLLGLGEVDQRRGLSVEALEHYGTVLVISESAPEFTSIWLIHNPLGNAHADLGELEEAHACYELCRETMGPDVAPRKAAIVLRNIGVAFAVGGALKSARRYFDEAARFWDRCEPCIGRARNLGNLGKLEVLLGRPERGRP
ncbi:MAG: tetratricopeptide repeat protein [Proteobacteria bacterium]|nr:tetratricopeptide repeat protein [Pseudomonadota bacterium]